MIVNDHSDYMNEREKVQMMRRVPCHFKNTMKWNIYQLRTQLDTIINSSMMSIKYDNTESECVTASNNYKKLKNIILTTIITQKVMRLGVKKSLVLMEKNISNHLLTKQRREYHITMLI